MVYADFRDPRQDIQDPPLAQSDPGAAPDPNDEEHMDARPDQEEMEEAINTFLLRLEKQEKKLGYPWIACFWGVTNRVTNGYV